MLTRPWSGSQSWMVAFLIRALANVSDTFLIIIAAFASHIGFSSWTQNKQPSMNHTSVLLVQVHKLGQGHFDLTKHIFGSSSTNDDNVMSFYIQKVKGQLHCDIILSSKTILWPLFITQPRNSGAGRHTPMMQFWLPLSEIKDPLFKDCYNYDGESATIIIVNCMCAGVITGMKQVGLRKWKILNH